MQEVPSRSCTHSRHCIDAPTFVQRTQHAAVNNGTIDQLRKVRARRSSVPGGPLPEQAKRPLDDGCCLVAHGAVPRNKFDELAHQASRTCRPRRGARALALPAANGNLLPRAAAPPRALDHVGGPHAQPQAQLSIAALPAGTEAPPAALDAWHTYIRGHGAHSPPHIAVSTGALPSPTCSDNPLDSEGRKIPCLSTKAKRSTSGRKKNREFRRAAVVAPSRDGWDRVVSHHRVPFEGAAARRRKVRSNRRNGGDLLAKGFDGWVVCHDLVVRGRELASGSLHRMEDSDIHIR